MPDPAWPATLPPRPLRAGYQTAFGQGAISTAMDSGPPKTRKRFTAVVRPLRMTFRMGFAQLTTLKNFYENDCAFGAIAFTFVDPVSGDTIRLQFKADKPPSIAPGPGVKFDVSLELDWLPA
jgi:hypothetical protein